ncbi:HIT family protein [Serratia marcescens]
MNVHHYFLITNGTTSLCTPLYSMWLLPLSLLHFQAITNSMTACIFLLILKDLNLFLYWLYKGEFFVRPSTPLNIFFLTFPSPCYCIVNSQRKDVRMPSCIACRISQRIIPSCIVYETEKLICFLDHDPINTGHVLICPKKHYASITDLPDSLQSLLF